MRWEGTGEATNPGFFSRNAASRVDCVHTKKTCGGVGGSVGPFLSRELSTHTEENKSRGVALLSALTYNREVPCK